VMYFIGGAPVILFFILRRAIPESPRWLAEKGRLAEADRALATFESRAKGPLAPLGDVSAYDAMTGKHPRRRVRDLLSKAYIGRTLAVWMLWATCGFIQYGLSTWLPTIYKTVYHAPLQLALNLAAGASVLGVIGSLVCAMIVDKVGRKPVINVSFILCAISLALAGVFHAESVYVVAGLCALSLGFLASGFITAYVYTPELYPTSIRAMGCGFGGRVAEAGGDLRPDAGGQHDRLGQSQYRFLRAGDGAVRGGADHPLPWHRDQGQGARATRGLIRDARHEARGSASCHGLCSFSCAPIRPAPAGVAAPGRHAQAVQLPQRLVHRSALFRLKQPDHLRLALPGQRHHLLMQRQAFRRDAADQLLARGVALGIQLHQPAAFEQPQRSAHQRLVRCGLQHQFCKRQLPRVRQQGQQAPLGHR